MMKKQGTSFGYYPPSEQRLSAFDPLALPEHFLPYGQGRSYGDVCLNSSGVLVENESLDHFLAFDADQGVVTCQPGVTLQTLLRFCLPRGWFLPVTPGTQYVSVGGAIANDVHGKNHEQAGSFGHYVLAFTLLRSNGEYIHCSESENTDFFHATIGGLGLTGMIVSAQLKLKKVVSNQMDVTLTPYQHLDDFFTLNKQAQDQDEYRVAWLDCTAKGDNLGRGHLIYGRHSSKPNGCEFIKPKPYQLPLTPPISLINNLSVKAFNLLYYHKQGKVKKHFAQGYGAFFYPLDGIRHWNRLYGKKGFFQHQSVVPLKDANVVIAELLKTIAKSGSGSFLVVLKMMGAQVNQGLISFPMQGVTLAMDFPMSKSNMRLMKILEAIVTEASGKLYPAKDALMSPAHFQQAYPQFVKLESLRDPSISSDFWKRVTV